MPRQPSAVCAIIRSAAAMNIELKHIAVCVATQNAQHCSCAVVARKWKMCRQMCVCWRHTHIYWFWVTVFKMANISKLSRGEYFLWTHTCWWSDMTLNGYFLQDINDEIPRFRSSLYEAEISENAQKNTPVTWIGGDTVAEVRIQWQWPREVFHQL